MRCSRALRRWCRRVSNAVRRVALLGVLPGLQALDALELSLERAGCPEPLATRATQACFAGSVTAAVAAALWTFWVYPVAAPTVLRDITSLSIPISYDFGTLSYALAQCLGCILLITLLMVHRFLAGAVTIFVVWPKALGCWSVACLACAWADDEEME